MNGRTCLIAAAWAFVLASAAPVGAQLVPSTPDNTQARVRIGPLSMNPSLLLSDVGVDTNLFFDPEAKDPKEDLAFSFVPQADVWMPMGRTWLTGNVRQDLIWFRDYTDERSANGAYRGGWIVPLSRVSLVVDGVWLRAKERPGFEIDERTQRREWAGSTAAEVRALGRTFLGGRLERRSIRFDSDEYYAGENLQEQLDRTRTTAGFGIRYELTPMTSLTTEVSGYQDRFRLSPSRDADSANVSGGVTFDPAALIKGSAQVGYRRFNADDAAVPDYQGLTFSGSLTYDARDSTRMSVELIRDVEYSYDNDQPYYLLSGVTTTVTQRIAGPLDAQGRIGFRTLAYRNRLGVVEVPTNRNDRVTMFGGGMGYRLGRDIRLSFDVERQERTSEIEVRTYQGFRYGFSILYGL